MEKASFIIHSIGWGAYMVKEKDYVEKMNKNNSFYRSQFLDNNKEENRHCLLFKTVWAQLGFFTFLPLNYMYAMHASMYFAWTSSQFPSNISEENVRKNLTSY